MPSDAPTNVHERLGRVEAQVDATTRKLSKVAEDVDWIKGYLQKHDSLTPVVASPVPLFRRDVAMVGGGGGVVGVVIFLLEAVVARLSP